MERSSNNTNNNSRVVQCGVWFVSDDRVHIRNLNDPRTIEYPDNLNIPILCLNDSLRNYPVPPILLNLAIYAGRIRNANPRRQPAELFSRLRDESMVWACSAVFQDLAVVPENIFIKTWRWIQRMPVPAVDRQQLIEKMADGIAEVFTQEAKCVNAPDPDPDVVQLLAVGGVHMDLQRRLMTDESWYVINSAVDKAKAKLRQKGLSLPKGAEDNIVVAPIFSQSNRRGFVSIPIIRVFPVIGMKARDFLPKPLPNEPLEETGFIEPHKPAPQQQVEIFLPDGQRHFPSTIYTRTNSSKGV